MSSLLERSTAVESLSAIADELRHAKAAMLAFVPQAEHVIVETFFSRTVEASGEASAAFACTWIASLGLGQCEQGHHSCPA